MCQDFAHLMLALLRLRQVPCRYVSGYLHVERKKREPSQSHAWVEFHSPTAGWVPFDPAHNRPVDDRYVVVGHGRHYDDVPPNKGIYRGIAKETLKAEVVTEVVPGKIVSRFVRRSVTSICRYFAKSPRALPTASSPTSPMPALTSNNSSRPLHSLLSGLALDAPPELQRVANAVEDLPNPARPGKRDRAVAEHSAAQSLVDRQRLDLS